MSEWVNEWAIGRMRAIHILIKQHTHTQTHIETHLISISISIGNSIYFYFHIFFYNQYSHTECGAVYGLFYFHFFDVCFDCSLCFFLATFLSLGLFVCTCECVCVSIFIDMLLFICLFIFLSLALMVRNFKTRLNEWWSIFGWSEQLWSKPVMFIVPLPVYYITKKYCLMSTKQNKTKNIWKFSQVFFFFLLKMSKTFNGLVAKFKCID